MLKKILTIAVLVAIVMIGTVGYLYLKPTEAASAPVTAIPLDVTTETAVTSATTAQVETAATVSEESLSEESASAESATATAQSAQLFEIVATESEARFIIDEVLNGTPTTVVGVTDQVAGQLAVDTRDVSNVQVGTIQINARTLTTDSDMRNRAIGNRILFTDEYEYITFTPTAISGLPESVSVGNTLTFQVTGDLTILDVTQPVTFEMQVIATSADRLEGTATATIAYADFGISIPNVLSVTDVEETVSLELEFAAVAV